MQLVHVCVSGSLGQNWSVTHTPSKICAFHHTSLALPCKFTYPKDQTVSTSAWHYRKSVGATPVAVSGVQDFGEHGVNCSLTLNNLTQDSAGIYQFSFTTNTSAQTLTNQHGVTLEVTGEVFNYRMPVYVHIYRSLMGLLHLLLLLLFGLWFTRLRVFTSSYEVMWQLSCAI